VNQVLVVAKTPAVRDQLKSLVQQSGVTVDVLEDFDPAILQITQDPPVLVLSENPPNDDIMAKLHETLKKHAPVTPLLLYIPECDSAVALKRMGEGAFDCLCPPLSAGDFLAAGKRAVSRLGRRLLTSKVVRRRAFWQQPPAVMGALFVLFILFVAYGFKHLWTAPYQLFKLGSEHPVAVAGADTHLWVADWSQQSVSEIKPKGDYLSIVDVYRFPDVQPVAVALAPYYAYTASPDGRLNRHRRDQKLSVTASEPGPGFAITGLAWDGEDLWSCDAETGKIYQHDARLNVKASFPAPVAKPAGLAWQKKNLWVADGEKNVLWKMTRDGASWRKQGPYDLEFFALQKNFKISGFTIWDGKAWFVSEDERTLVSHRLPEGK